MALNPAYAQQSTRKLPFGLGYVYGTGVQVNSITGFDGSTVAQYILGAGEWDGMVQFSAVDSQPFLPGSLLNVNAVTLPGSLADYVTTLPDYFHFHAGQYSPKGVPLNLISLGPDQGSDNWFQYFPSVTPALNYSGFAYYVVRILEDQGALTNLPTGNLNPIGVWRATRCRIFDSTGQVTGYGFTVNPTWQMIETLLRFQLKRQQPPLAGLIQAERNLFDWPAMVAHAERNAFVLANGAPRFAGNFLFAADAKLGAMMETQLRNCRSYKRERGGVISFVGDDARTSVFIASKRAIVPGSLKLHAKDVSTAANIIVPQYRELNIPAVTQVQTAVAAAAKSATFTTVGAQPFFSSDYFAYDGGDSPGTFAGDYRVGLYLNETLDPPAPEAPPIANQFFAEGGPPAAATANGGYLGTEQSRFKAYQPDVVQHRAHQTSFGQVAPGVPAFPTRTKGFYDMGNNTFDQTNRLAQWIKVRDLGPDVTPYLPPVVGTVEVFAEAVDVNNACAGEIESGDVITLDPTADPVFAGSYVVQDPVTDNPPGGDKLATRELALQTYQPTAFTDASTPPGNSYQTLTALAYPTADTPMTNPFYFMQGTPTGCVNTTTDQMTIGLPDLSIWWAGQPTPTSYAGVSLSGIPYDAHIILYLWVSSYGGAAPYLTVDSSATNPPIPLAAGQIVIFIGTVTSAPVCTAGGGGGGPFGHFAGAPGGTGGGSTPLIFTSPTGYYGAAPVSGPPAAATPP